MISVNRTDNMHMTFKINLHLPVTRVRYYITDTAETKILLEGEGSYTYDSREIITEAVDFSQLEEGYYKIFIVIESGEEKKSITELLRVEGVKEDEE